MPFSVSQNKYLALPIWHLFLPFLFFIFLGYVFPLCMNWKTHLQINSNPQNHFSPLRALYLSPSHSVIAFFLEKFSLSLVFSLSGSLYLAVDSQKEMRWERVGLHPRHSLEGAQQQQQEVGEISGPGKRWGHTCNSIKGGRFLYVFGGYGRNNCQTNQVHVYDTGGSSKFWPHHCWISLTLSSFPPFIYYRLCEILGLTLLLWLVCGQSLKLFDIPRCFIFVGMAFA